MFTDVLYRETYWSGEQAKRTLTITIGTLNKCNHTDAPFYPPQVLIQNANTVKKKHQTPPLIHLSLPSHA